MCRYDDVTIVKVLEVNRVTGSRVRWIDRCLKDYIELMNEQGIVTVACCCGHGHGLGNILVESTTESAQHLTKYGYRYQMYWNGLLCHLITSYHWFNQAQGL